jgi:chaperonin cofactor prefoldin
LSRWSKEAKQMFDAIIMALETLSAKIEEIEKKLEALEKKDE